jgi:hypothetical protein
MAKMFIMRIFIAILLLGLMIACNYKEPSYLNPDDFSINEGTTLAFDLEGSNNFRAGLFVSEYNTSSEKNYLLPFKVSKTKDNINLLSSVGEYDNYTLVHFYTHPNINLIGFCPILTELSSEEVIGKNPDLGVYIIKSGLERMFVYDNSYYLKLSNNLKNINQKLDTLDYIAVKIPEKAKGLEIENGKTTTPESLSSYKLSKVFDGKTTKELKLKYLIDSDSTGSSWYWLIAKIFILIIVPILELGFVVGSHDQKWKRRWILAGIISELVILIAIIVLGYNNKLIGFDKLSDSITSVAVALIAIILLYKKDQKESEDKSKKTAYNNLYK